MEEYNNTTMSLNCHAPKAARFKDISPGSYGPGFGVIDIGEFPHEISLLITGTFAENLHFLYQLREAVEKAFKYELEK